MAADLGVAVAHPVAPAQAEAVEAPSERRLESRSSGDASQTLEPVEPAAVAAETAPEPRAQEAAPDLGSPAAQGEAPAVEEAVIVEVAAVEIVAAPAVAPEPVPAEAAPDLGEPAAQGEALAVEEAAVVEVAAVEIAAPPEVAPSLRRRSCADWWNRAKAKSRRRRSSRRECAVARRLAGSWPRPEPALAVASAPEPVPEAAAVAPVQKIEVKPAEPKRKEPKTLFKLWLDLAFGRKD